MKTFLLTWNPSRWEWVDFPMRVSRLKAGKTEEMSWSCGNTRKIGPGDRFFLMKLGKPGIKGIIGSGTVIGHPKAGNHFSDTGRIAHFVDIRFDTLLDPDKHSILTLEALQRGPLKAQKWTPEASGITVREEIAPLLERLWKEFSKPVELNGDPKTSDKPGELKEGSAYDVVQTRYERNPQARKKCIQHWGLACVVCDFDFEVVYGKLGRDFIHVHHLNQLSSHGQEVIVDPIKDLRPVCPNCHAMLHRAKDLLSIQKLKKLLQESGVQHHD